MNVSDMSDETIGKLLMMGGKFIPFEWDSVSLKKTEKILRVFKEHQNRKTSSNIIFGPGLGGESKK